MKYFLIFISILFSQITFSQGSFGGGGATGEWDEPDNCPPISYIYTATGYGISYTTKNGFDALASGFCMKAGATFVGWNVKDSVFNCETFGKWTHAQQAIRKVDPEYDPQCVLKCPDGYEKDANGKCQPKKCPVGQSLVNGQCKAKQCPVGQALDANGNCMARDDQCPSGQSLVNGRCKADTDKPEEDPEAKLPPFCEWASEMCEWHKEWQQWSNDYNANEEKANLDREELKRLGLDSKENLDEINQKMTEQNNKLDQLKIPLDQIKQQDQQFYDELRLWLKNFNPTNGNPSEQNPSIEFPPFCDWSVNMCNFYLDWKDWRSDYNAYNEVVKQKFDEHKQKLEDLEKLQQEQNEQDKQHYDENKDFHDDVRDFFDWYKNQEEDTQPPETPESTPDPVEVEENNVEFQPNESYVNATGSCPPDLVIPYRFIQSHEARFSYQSFCHGATLARPWVIFVGMITAFMIVSGFRGNSDE